MAVSDPVWRPSPPPGCRGGERKVSGGSDGGATANGGTGGSPTNGEDTPHPPRAAPPIRGAGWDTGMLAKGESKVVRFEKEGIEYYICTPHPWMYGEIIVEK